MAMTGISESSISTKNSTFTDSQEPPTSQQQQKIIRSGIENAQERSLLSISSFIPRIFRNINYFFQNKNRENKLGEDQKTNNDLTDTDTVNYPLNYELLVTRKNTIEDENPVEKILAEAWKGADPETIHAIIRALVPIGGKYNDLLDFLSNRGVIPIISNPQNILFIRNMEPSYLKQGGFIENNPNAIACKQGSLVKKDGGMINLNDGGINCIIKIRKKSNNIYIDNPYKESITKCKVTSICFTLEDALDNGAKIYYDYGAGLSRSAVIVALPSDKQIPVGERL